MNRRKLTPSYRLHKHTGKAIVTVYDADADGRRRGMLLPGKYERKESQAEYKRLLATLNANDGAFPGTRGPSAEPCHCRANCQIHARASHSILRRSCHEYLPPVVRRCCRISREDRRTNDRAAACNRPWLADYRPHLLKQTAAAVMAKIG